METPSSTRRVTRSLTLAAKNSNNGKFEESEKTVTRTRQKSGINPQDRSALIDITNDSPIVGLAMGNLDSPSSTMSKKRINSHSKYTFTPGSGEALLRGQVKTLLQKVEEEGEFSKMPLDKGPLFNLKCLLNSPMNLLAPTPANTPQILNSDELDSAIPSPVEYNFVISQNGEGSESEKDLITRALDFSEKSEGSECSSVINRGSSSAVKVGSGKEPKNSAKLSEPVSEDVGTLVSNSSKLPPPMEASAKVFWEGLCQDSPVAVVNCKDKVVDSIPSPELPSKTFSGNQNNDTASQIVDKIQTHLDKPSSDMEQPPLQNLENNNHPEDHSRGTEVEEPFTTNNDERKRSDAKETFGGTNNDFLLRHKVLFS
ncbi:chaperonin CPN60 [Forsythia ovata]|uniref:Chaperonin CPN60 n=1 Tax=Forsythia ovata TaxID=205694 RepID=A0ABD1U6Y9_9LAMI